MNEKLSLQPLPINSVSVAPVQVKSGLIEELIDLVGSPNLDETLSRALGIIVRLFGAEAGSLLFCIQSVHQVRSGLFRPDVLKRIQNWEQIIGRRLQESTWRLSDQADLSASSFKLTDPAVTLVSIPLLSNSNRVVGSLSLVLPAGREWTSEQRDLLRRIACGVGQTASLVAELNLAQQRLRQMGIFYKVGQALMTTFDINRLLSDAMQLATEVIDAGAASLMLIDEKHEELVFEVSLGSRGHVLRQQRIPLDEGIAGWVARHGQPAIANDARTDPRFSHRVDVRTGFLTQSIAAVPLKVKGRVIGVLEVLNKYAESGFNQEDVQLMSAIAAQAAIAIENARLYQQLRQERDHIIKAQEEVRRELNRKLHDGPVQLLSAISMSLDHLERLIEFKPEAVKGEIAAIHSLVHQTTREARNILFELRPLILETQGLVPALEQYANQLRETETFTLHFKGVEPVNFHLNIAGTIFSIVQEALNNARRHANAHNVWLLLETRNEHFVVTVRDDGKGFDIDKNDEGYEKRGSFGILNMRERAALIDAELQIESRMTSPNRGTSVQLILPLPPA